ncbi:hypothetical protein Vafri_20570, partial [Volvox africanus]
HCEAITIRTLQEPGADFARTLIHRAQPAMVACDGLLGFAGRPLRVTSTMKATLRCFSKQIDMSYPKVTIVNSTPYVARGQVDYLSLFCSDDGYTVSANGATWTGPDRGVCLVKKVSATLNTPQGNVEAEAYTSSGTAYSQYAIIYQPNGNGFAVTRIVS